MDPPCLNRSEGSFNSRFMHKANAMPAIFPKERPSRRRSLGRQGAVRCGLLLGEHGGQAVEKLPGVAQRGVHVVSADRAQLLLVPLNVAAQAPATDNNLQIRQLAAQHLEPLAEITRMRQ